jgi:hypothetical protein
MKHMPQERYCICIHKATAQSVKEAKYKDIQDVSLILKPSKTYANQPYIIWRNL